MDINELLYPDREEVKPQSGDMLIAEPMLAEDYFNRSAVLLLDHPGEEGFFGLVMNRETNLSLKDLMPDLRNGELVKVFCGGPVGMERLFLVHTLGDRLSNSYEFKKGLYVGADIDELTEYIEQGGETEGKLRIFLGYSGWSEGQLEGELRRKSWALNQIRNSEGILDSSGIDYWRREVGLLGEDFRSWLMVPPDPSFN